MRRVFGILTGVFVACCALSLAAQAQEADYEVFDPAAFDVTRSATVDNRWLPLSPGAQLTLDGQAIEDGEVIPHRIVFVTTDLVKEVAGIPTVVVWVRDYAEGTLVEAELAFFAQDRSGTVWHFGEYPEEYEDGVVVDAPTWIAGFEGARPGIVMMATPEPSETSYSQGWGPAVGWTDRGRVVDAGQMLCVAAGCYQDVVVTEEFTKEEPGAFQVKAYAPGVGNIRVGWRGSDPNQERLELTSLVRLDVAGLAQARDAALALEKSAYAQSPNVYGLTSPVEPRASSGM